jgi:hypothetical protein
VPRLPFWAPRRAIAILFTATIISPANLSASVGCATDVNGDLQTSVDDLLLVLNTWGQCLAICPADCAPSGGDDEVNVDDLLAVLNGWGDCPCTPGSGCMQVSHVWCEDWENGNYSRWTGSYGAPTSCEQTGFNTQKFVTPEKSHRSAVTCTTTQSHRGYAGLRFQGNTVLPNFSTPSSGGIDAPNGVLVTFWSWLKVPYTFSPTKWMSLMTVTHDCSNTWADVITLNLDDSSMKIKPVHVNSVIYAPNAPSMPQEQWVRTTVYINFYTDVLHVWQNGTKVCSATFNSVGNKMCQWHWGLYASGNNDNIILHEEDLRIVKLDEPLTNFTTEPWYTEPMPCISAPQ